MNNTNPLIKILVGASASGKTEILKRLIDDDRHARIQTATSRKPRPDDFAGIYQFMSREAFEKGIENGMFLEYTVYAGEYYGTPLKAVNDLIEQGKIPVAILDIDGAHKYKSIFGNNVKVIYIYRDKKTIIESIMERNIPIGEKSKRILQLDKEFENIAHCDKCIINNKTINDAVQAIRLM